MENLTESTVGAQSRNAIVMVGRMNPPHVGHYKVIDAMRRYIREHKELNLSASPIVVVIAGDKSSEDKIKNPLTAEERISFMKASGRADNVKFLISNNAFNGFEEVRKLGFEPKVIAAGSDRSTKYLEMLNKYFTDNEKPIEHFELEGLTRTDNGEASLDSAITDGKTNVSAASASLAREAVRLGYEDVFAKITGLEKKPKLAKILFNKIKKASE